MDLSDALLDMARARVLELGLQTQVVLVEGDINDPAVRKKLPKKADLVTCSYCPTMIPKWKDALKSMLDLVEPGGNLALIDFVTARGAGRATGIQNCTSGGSPWTACTSTAATWTGCALQKNLATIWYSEEESRVPYTPYRPTHHLTAREDGVSAARNVSKREASRAEA